MCVCVCVCVIKKRQQWGGLDPNWAVALQKKELNFSHRAACILRQAFHCSPENAFYIFNQQIYFII